MKERNLIALLDVPIGLNMMRIFRRIRAYGHGVRPAGKMERHIRNRAAFKKPGGRRSIFKRRRAGA